MAFIENIHTNQLLLDDINPRFPVELQQKTGSLETKQNDILKHMKANFHLEDLADSMNENGFLPTEALIVIPIANDGENFHNLTDEEFQKNIKKSIDTRKFIVVEGNRRLSTVKLLQDETLAEEIKWTIKGSDSIRQSVKLPCFILKSRESVATTLGVKHIVSVLKWEAKEKAAYIYRMFTELPDNKKNNTGLDELQKKLGVGKTDSIRKSLYAYIWLTLLNKNEEGMFVEFSEKHFSYLVLAIGQSGIKDFIDMPRNWKDVDFREIIAADHKHAQYEKIKDLCKVLSDPNIVEESRDITKDLSRIYKSPKAIYELKITRNKEIALLYVDGVEEIDKEFRKIVDKLDLIKNNVWTRIPPEEKKRVITERILPIENTLKTFKEDIR